MHNNKHSSSYSGINHKFREHYLESHDSIKIRNIKYEERENNRLMETLFQRV